ncbi:hypothetical protein CASFOL_004751 [Castilleja foliolosa]|uniref:Sialate O-acetylesterase domain-containing protein n=1 Tax=Castilleja foliolosa TaxID=1961234 RepID=A0ABD3EC26_9LAMI
MTSMDLPNSTAKQIFVLAGQSNMSGRGGVHNSQWDGVIPPDSAADPSRIFRLGPHLRWEAALEPLHQMIDADRICGVGPGMSFANAIKERVGAVGLVPCAVAGTAVKDWARGMAAYDNMVRRVKAAQGGGEIKALLWFQGEKDTFTEEDANVYKENIERFIVGVRQDLDLPSLPIILVSALKLAYLCEIVWV